MFFLLTALGRSFRNCRRRGLVTQQTKSVNLVQTTVSSTFLPLFTTFLIPHSLNPPTLVLSSLKSHTPIKMHLLRGVLRFLVVSSVTVASPKPLSESSITINQVLKPEVNYQETIPHYGIASYAKALSKYGASEEKVAHVRALALRHGTNHKFKTTNSRSRSSRRQITTSSEVPDAQCTSGSQTSGPISTIPDTYDEQYVSQITIGNRSFWIDFDTGSSDL